MSTIEIISIISLIFTGITVISSIVFGFLNFKKSKNIEEKIIAIENNYIKTIQSKDKYDIENVGNFDNRKSIK